MEAPNPLQIVFGQRRGWSLFVLLCILGSAVLVGSADWPWIPTYGDGFWVLLLATKLGLVLTVGGLLAFASGLTVEFLVGSTVTAHPTSLFSQLPPFHVVFPCPTCRGVRRPPRFLC